MEVKRSHTIWESYDNQSAWGIISYIFALVFEILLKAPHLLFFRFYLIVIEERLYQTICFVVKVSLE